MVLLTGVEAPRTVVWVADDPTQDPNACPACLGEGGNWVEKNGTRDEHDEWVRCEACHGSGSRP